jgi:pimeloyl-ACP methyl ester carboxylesterase
MMSQTSPTSPEPHRRETVWVYSQGAPQVFQGDLDYYLGEHDLTTTASQIDTSKTQVHVISGDYDWSATPERSKALADAIPGATYTRMEGMGHFPMSESPVEFERYLRVLLDRIVA